MDSIITTAPIIPARTIIGNGAVVLHEVIGSGSYGHIYLGERTRPISDRENTPAFVAVKTLPKADLPQSQIDLLHIEFDLQHSLESHDNIVTVYDLLEDDHYIYMIMELCEGGDLFDLITREQHVGSKGAVGIRDKEVILAIFHDVVSAVAHAHRHGIFHRDIKPENIVATGDRKRWKLADFGLATRDRESFEHETGSSVYIAPEQFTLAEKGFPYNTAPADVWSLGVLLLAMFVGRHPWVEANKSDPAFAAFLRQPDSLRNSFPILSDSAWSLLLRMLDINPSTRITIPELERIVNSPAELKSLLIQTAPSQPSSVSSGDSGVYCMGVKASEDEPSTPLIIPNHPNLASKRDSVDSGIGSWADVADLELDFDSDPFACHRGSPELKWTGIEQRLDDVDDYVFEMEM